MAANNGWRTFLVTLMVASSGCGSDPGDPVVLQGAFEADRGAGLALPVRQVAIVSTPPCSVDLRNASLIFTSPDKYLLGAQVVFHCSNQTDSAAGLSETGTYIRSNQALVLHALNHSGLTASNATVVSDGIAIDVSILEGSPVSLHFKHVSELIPH